MFVKNSCGLRNSRVCSFESGGTGKHLKESYLLSDYMMTKVTHHLDDRSTVESFAI